MCIDDNIPADNYCGIILKAEQQEDTDIYGNVKWRRIYLWVDIAKGLYKGYFSNRYTITGRKEWQGVMSLYMPTTDNCSSTDDVTTYQRYKKKIDMVTSKNPQKYRPIEAFSIIGQILTCKQCFEKVTLP